MRQLRPLPCCPGCNEELYSFYISEAAQGDTVFCHCGVQSRYDCGRMIFVDRRALDGQSKAAVNDVSDEEKRSWARSRST